MSRHAARNVRDPSLAALERQAKRNEKRRANGHECDLKRIEPEKPHDCRSRCPAR
jgi:hypothetical protein